MGRKVHIDMSCGDASDQSRRFCVLSWDQVQRLDSILGEAVPIHGRGNFPTLSVQPSLLVQVKFINKQINGTKVARRPAKETTQYFKPI